MNAPATALPAPRPEQPAPVAATDTALVIELFDQWTGPVEASPARLCWYTRADVAA